MRPDAAAAILGTIFETCLCVSPLLGPFSNMLTLNWNMIPVVLNNIFLPQMWPYQCIRPINNNNINALYDRSSAEKRKVFTYLLLHAFWMSSGAGRLIKLKFLSGATLFQVQIWPATSRVDSRKWPENLWKVLMYLNFIDGKRPRVKFWYIWNILCMYRISSYSFRGNYSFLDSEIQRSQ